MEIERGRISPLQFLFAVAGFVQGSTILTSFVIKITEQDSWIVMVLASLLSIPVALLYGALIRRFPGKTLFDMLTDVFGEIVGRCIAALYCFFFMTVGALNLRDVGEFVGGSILTETPMVVIILSFLVVTLWSVRKGVETLTRFSFLILTMSIAIILFNTVLLFGDMHLENFQPIWRQPIMDYVQGTHTILTIPICETVFFLMLIPSVKEPPKAARSLLWGMVIGAVILFTIVMRDIAVLGPVALYFAVPSFEAVRLIRIASILTRMEILIAFIITVFYFFKISVMLYVCSLSFAHLLKLKAYRPLSSMIGLVMGVMSLVVVQNAGQNAEWGAQVAPIFNTLFEIIFPLLILMVAALRGLGTKKRAKGRAAA